MPEAVSLSEAKRILLDKCVRGEVALMPRTSQAQEMSPQEVIPSAGAVEGDATEKGEATLPPSSRSKSLIRKALNRILHLICRFGPGGTTLRPFLHRMRGVRIGKNVWIGDDVYLDNEFPQCIEIQDGAMIELRTTLIAHTHGAGRVVIGKNAFVGAGSVIVAAAKRTLVIGEGSVIMASSMVNRSVAPYTLYGSDCAKPLAQVTRPFTATTSYEEFIATLRPMPH